MARSRLAWQDAVAACCAAGLLLSLWLHWYSFRIPGYVIDAAESLASRVGVLGPYLTRESELVRAAGTLHVDAWRAFGTIDVVLAVLAVLAGAMALLNLVGRAVGTGRPIALSGLLALILAGYRAAVPPGPSGLLHPSTGAYVALGCSLALVAIGLASAGEAETEASALLHREPAWLPVAAVSPVSVPPPSSGNDGVLRTALD